ncbi:MAG: MarR family winged helix-turn-helix transcriptional regulator [Mogibacterium sp.]|nr:MarR family winged helix-turn-helix transcriptional regulator [Mogibacterium sp.]
MNEFHSIGQSVFIAEKYFKQFFKEAVKPFGLNRAEAMTLMMLCADKSLAELHYDKGVLSRTLQCLEDKGYITRSASEADGRANDIKVTASAIEIGRSIDRIIVDWNNKVLSGIEDKELLKRMLCIMIENARHLANEKVK